jgi:uncharacterized membrane protein
MQMSNEIVIAAPAERIFQRASDTPHWPEMLAHYRYVRVLASDGARSIVEMAARRPFEKINLTIPVRWRAEQINDAAAPQIFFRHLSGWTSGMRVYWRFTPAAGGKTRVRIDHELHSPLAGFIGKYFIDPIATRTLARMKEICEQP